MSVLKRINPSASSGDITVVTLLAVFRSYSLSSSLIRSSPTTCLKTPPELMPNAVVGRRVDQRLRHPAQDQQELATRDLLAVQADSAREIFST